MFISRHTLKWTKTCRSSGDFPHAHTAHFLLNRHTSGGRREMETRPGIGNRDALRPMRLRRRLWPRGRQRAQRARLGLLE